MVVLSRSCLGDCRKSAFGHCIDLPESGPDPEIQRAIFPETSHQRECSCARPYIRMCLLPVSHLYWSIGSNRGGAWGHHIQCSLPYALDFDSFPNDISQKTHKIGLWQQGLQSLRHVRNILIPCPWLSQKRHDGGHQRNQANHGMNALCHGDCFYCYTNIRSLSCHLWINRRTMLYQRRHFIWNFLEHCSQISSLKFKFLRQFATK
jgi:hypothetical protein